MDKFRLGLVVWLSLLLLAGCASAPATLPGGPQGTPTQSLYFGQTAAVHALPTQQPADHPQTPTVAGLFTGKPAATQVTTQAGALTPTLSDFFKPTNAGTPTPPAPAAGQDSTPTAAQYFEKKPSATPDPAHPSRTPLPAAGGAQNATAQAVTDRGQLNLVPVFSGDLDPSWTLDNSWGVKLGIEDAASFAYQGKKSVRLAATEDYGSIFFTVKKDAARQFPRKKITGVSFWVNPGDNPIRPDQLAVSVVGSNENPYWLKGDTTVTSIGKGQPFSETRLYFLNVNRSLPANTWTEILVWLDKLIYDPDYLYVTGLYVKTDKDFRSTFYVAEVNLFELK